MRRRKLSFHYERENAAHIVELRMQQEARIEMSNARLKHLNWCKSRAMAALDKPHPTADDCLAAVSSFASDICKSILTAPPDRTILLMGLACKDPQAARRWISGFQ